MNYNVKIEVLKEGETDSNTSCSKCFRSMRRVMMCVQYGRSMEMQEWRVCDVCFSTRELA